MAAHEVSKVVVSHLCSHFNKLIALENSRKVGDQHLYQI